MYGRYPILWRAKKKLATRSIISSNVLQNDRSFEGSPLNSSRVKSLKISSVERIVGILWLCEFQVLFERSIWHRCPDVLCFPSDSIPPLMLCLFCCCSNITSNDGSMTTVLNHNTTQKLKHRYLQWIRILATKFSCLIECCKKKMQKKNKMMIC